MGRKKHSRSKKKHLKRYYRAYKNVKWGVYVCPFVISVQFSTNNILFTLSERRRNGLLGSLFSSSAGGSTGEGYSKNDKLLKVTSFRGKQKVSYAAVFEVGLFINKMARKLKFFDIALHVRGRTRFFKQFWVSLKRIHSRIRVIRDVTPISHNGSRKPKPRRV